MAETGGDHGDDASSGPGPRSEKSDHQGPIFWKPSSKSADINSATTFNFRNIEGEASLEVRQRLEKLTQWKSPVSEIAVSLASSI